MTATITQQADSRSDAALAVEVRVTLGDRPVLLTSPLPGPQPGCRGWHAQLPVADPQRVTAGPGARWGDVWQGAGPLQGCAQDEIEVFTPRRIAVGVVCVCGYYDDKTTGQVGRVQCPACGGTDMAPRRVVNTLRLSGVPQEQHWCSSGLPLADLLWTYRPGTPTAEWVPWLINGFNARLDAHPYIGLIGLGALGSPAAEVVVRLGYAAYLVDRDFVESKNLQVSYRLDSLGQSKAESARRALIELVPDARVGAWHGDLISDVGLGIMADWDAAVLSLDNVSAKIAASEYLEILGVPYVQGQVDGASTTALARTYLPGRSCCLQCLLDPDELEVEAEFSCRRVRADQGSGRPRLFTTPIETHIGAGLIAAQLARLVPPPAAGGARAEADALAGLEQREEAVHVSG